MVSGTAKYVRHDHRVLLGLLMFAFALAGMMVLGGGRALASHVACGDTIKADTTLDSDLIDCPHDGIVIGADDITLDLNGHTVDGDGVNQELPDTGIDNAAGHDGVTIKSGSIRGFIEGVVIKRAHENVVRDLATSHQFHSGIFVRGSSDVGIEDNSVFSNAAGIVLFRVSHVRVEHNSVHGSDFGGIPVYESDHVVVARNSVSGSGESGIYLLDSDRNRVRRNRTIDNQDGIQLENSDHNRVRRNRTTGNELAGVFLQGSDRNVVRRNQATRNDVGILVFAGDRNVIARNHSSRGRAGIGIEKGRGNLVARNLVRGARDGIYIGLKGNPPVGGSHNRVRRNRVRGSGRDAFFVSEKARHNHLFRNVAIGAEDDGFDIESRSAKLTGNRARRNHDLGIEAVRGVIDGGGNIARHNGDARQCTHISCG